MAVATERCTASVGYFTNSHCGRNFIWCCTPFGLNILGSDIIRAGQDHFVVRNFHRARLTARGPHCHENALDLRVCNVITSDEIYVHLM